jgi:hypothetical protein
MQTVREWCLGSAGFSLQTKFEGRGEIEYNRVVTSHELSNRFRFGACHCSHDAATGLIRQLQYGLGLSCNNSMLRGSYAAQMNVDHPNVVVAPSSSSDAGFGSSSGPASSTGINISKAKLLGLSRYYFDGSGNIIGTVSSTAVTTSS